MMKMNQKTLLSEVLDVKKTVPDDPMGASPVGKCFLMSYLVEELALKTFVEIGIYKGRSLFSVGKTIRRMGGQAIGMDPYSAEHFRENDLDEATKEQVNAAADSIQFSSLFAQVLDTRRKLELENTVRILRMTDEEAYKPLQTQLNGIDLLHIDGNHDTVFVAYDAAHYIPLVRAGGIIVFDDTHWPSVRCIYEKYAAVLPILYENPYFSILYKPQDGCVLEEDIPGFGEKDGASDTCKTLDRAFIHHYQSCLPALFDNVEDVLARQSSGKKPTLFVGVLVYNHEKYIEQCLESIFQQMGNFSVQLVVIDDNSTDDSWKIERELQETHPQMKLIHNTVNQGYVRNYVTMRRLFEESGCDYLAYVEGDDYLLSPARMDEQLRFLEEHPECAWVFNDLVLYYQSEDRYEVYPDQLQLRKERYRANDLAAKAFVGTWSASMFRRNAMLHIPEEFTLEMASSDWLSGVLAAECGDIGHIRRPLSVYRKHSSGAWSGMKTQEANYKLYCLLQKFNRWTQYNYYSQNCLVLHFLPMDMKVPKEREKIQDLLIIDDTYPHPGSGFRLEEFTSILLHFKHAKCLTNGANISHLDKKRRIAEWVADFKRNNPELAGQVDWSPERSYTGPERYRAAYFCFLQNTFFALPGLEQTRTPFVLELYPGGGMAFDNPEVDKQLKTVFSSPCFRKVIVTQDATENYLLRKKLCRRSAIEKIFGVVIPREHLDNAVSLKEIVPSVGPLKLCFVAYRYTPTGEDKGYDVFLEAAKILYSQNQNYRFHVVGSFDESVLDTSGLDHSITFHGTMESGELPLFLRDMDILLSPNRPGKIYAGSFDGFPTSCCTEAMLQGTLAMITDPLEMNGGRYQPGREIEIIDTDPEKIAERVTWYDSHREALADVCKAQLEKTLTLYSAEAQIAPRIRILEKMITSSPVK